MPKIVTRRKMGWIALGFHWFMMLITVGLWTPVFLAARRGRNTTTHIPDGYAGPIPGQPYAPQQPYAPPPAYRPPQQPYGQQPPGQWGQPRR